MNNKYQLFWGDMHHNTYQHYVQDPPLMDVVGFASTHLDFYTGAYYTPAFDFVPDEAGCRRARSAASRAAIFPKRRHRVCNGTASTWRTSRTPTRWRASGPSSRK